MNRRTVLLAAVVGAAALVAVVLIVVASSGSSSAKTSDTTVSTSVGRAAESAFLNGVPQNGDTLGRANAPATLTVYEDPQCPYCRDWTLNTLPTVVQNYVRTGKVKLVYHGIRVVGPNSETGLRAIYAAGNQDKLWNLADVLYHVQGAENSGWITDAVIRSAAATAGAKAEPILAASSSPKVTAALQRAAEHATADGIQGTPTFVVTRPPALPQQLQLSALDSVSFATALDAALQ